MRAKTAGLSMVLAALVAQPVRADDEHARNMAAGLELFKSSVRATLIESCVHCHGGEDTESGFDLTTRESLMKGGDYEEPPIKPGDPDGSWLYKLVTHAEEPKMPAEASKLKPDQLAAIRRWIELGAPYDKPLIDPNVEQVAWTERKVPEEAKQYWAFAPLHAAVPPEVPGENWSQTPVDQFILARLRAAKSHPNPRADRRILIRRVYLDLLGLPPTAEEVAAFVADKDPQAYEKLVDRLLANPAYGERWARHWLDVARFAESEGGEQDYNRSYAYHYRDFVIRALNDDMPYDQFVRWQLAGDEFAPDDPLAMMATGFLVAGSFPTQLTEREFEPARYDQLDDMASTTTVAFLGLTAGCARCHDHKFDPIPARDYYRLLSNFTHTIRSEASLDLSTPEQRRESEAKRQLELAAAEKPLKQFEATELSARFDAFVTSLPPQQSEARPWQVLQIVEHSAESGAKFEALSDGSLLVLGPAAATDTYTLVVDSPLDRIHGLRLEALTHDSFPRRGPGLASNGNFCLSDVRVTAAPMAGGKAVPVNLMSPQATHQQNAGDLSLAASLDENLTTSGWAVDFGGIGHDQAAAFAFEKPVEFSGGARLTVTLRFHHSNGRHAIGRPRLAVTQQDPATIAITSDGAGPTIPAEVAAVLESLRVKKPVSAADQAKARAWYAATLPEWKTLHAAVEKVRTAPSVAHMATVQIGSEGVRKLNHHANGRGYPHFYPVSYFLKRGDVAQKEGEATPGYLQALIRGGVDETYWQEKPPEGGHTSYRRHGLAKWITDVDHGAGHLAARVIVNRLWYRHTGRGLVATPNDFGHQAEPPSHPELLDWLATKLIEGGWRLKPIHRLIVTSAVYTQDTAYDEVRAAIDPENALCWRRTIRRLEAEAIRDQMLAVSGELDPTMYGPGQTSPAMKRRSIYFFLKRSQMPAMLHLFDIPEPLVSQGSRPATTIAPQALLFMNNREVQQSARSFAARLAPATAESSEAAVTRAYELALCRAPAPAELTAGTAFLASQAAAYEERGARGPQQLALNDFCQSVFCLSEFIFVE